MPEKRYVRGCGKSCIRCWVNNLKHGNKLKKKQFPKQNFNGPWVSVRPTDNEKSEDDEELT